MKTIRVSLLLSVFVFSVYLLSSCKAQYGCPSNGKNVGAERILSGDKVPKAKKFRS